MVDPDDISTLTDTDSARWQAAAAMIDAMSAGVIDGSVDADELMATINHIGRLGVDPMRFTDTVHVPEDAGPHRGALVSILSASPTAGDGGSPATPAGTR